MESRSRRVYPPEEFHRMIQNSGEDRAVRGLSCRVVLTISPAGRMGQEAFVEVLRIKHLLVLSTVKVMMKKGMCGLVCLLWRKDGGNWRGENNFKKKKIEEKKGCVLVCLLSR